MSLSIGCLRQYSAGMSVISRTMFVVFLLGSSAMAGSATQPAYTTDPGPVAIDVWRRLTLHDARRNKDLYLTVVTPRDGGPYPVILFSHGAGGSPGTYLNTLKLWASRGYVVIAPFHDDSLALRRMREGNPPEGSPKVGLVEQLRQAIQTAVYDQKGWVNRVDDIELVLDSLKTFPDQFPDLHAKMNLSEIGMSGHSLGAQTTVLVSGAVIDFSEQDTGHEYLDSRIKAAILMSGQGRGHMGFRKGSWDKVRLPMMVMTGTRDNLSGENGPDWKMEPFQQCPPGEKFAVLVRDANHFSFCSNLSAGLGQNRNTKIISEIELPTLAFWDAYLKDDPAARAFLHSDELTQSTQGDLQMWAR